MSAAHEDPSQAALPPQILRLGFRPFFLAGAAWALIALTLWIATLTGALTLPTRFDPVAWHRHEMLFGYLGAIIAGFLLTAVPSWTGRPPIAGPRLALLAGLWLAARLAMLASAHAGALLAVLLDVGFLALLAIMIAREIILARNRNIPVAIALSLLTLACALDHADALGATALDGIGWRAGFAIVIGLIALIGGRIIPAFTRNWLTRQSGSGRLPARADGFDRLALALLVVALLSWVALPGSQLAGALLFLAGLGQAARLARWAGLRCVREPLLFVLHLSFLWLPLGLILLGGAAFVEGAVVSAALHLLSAGAMASMTLAVMTRATLGHTGRPLRADGPTLGIFALVTIGALLRVAAPLMPDYLLAIEGAALFWGAAFLLFLLSYGPMMLRPRVDEQP